MNKQLKKQIAKFASKLEAIGNEMSDQGWLETAADDMQETYDNRSEAWQESDKGSEMSNLIDRLQDMVNKVRELSDLAEETASELTDLTNEE